MAGTRISIRHASLRAAASPLVGLIAATATAALAGIALGAPAIGDAVSDHLLRSVAFLALTLLLQLAAVPVPRCGSISVSGIGVLAAAISLGAGPAMAIATLAAAIQWIRHRGLLHRAIFDAANLATAGGAAGALYHAIAGSGAAPLAKLGAAALAGMAYTGINTLLLCTAMSLAEGASVPAIWLERFSWLTAHYLTFGPLALGAVAAYDRIGIAGVLAFAIPPALILVMHRRVAPAT